MRGPHSRGRAFHAMKRRSDLWIAKLLGWRCRIVFQRPRDPLQLVLVSACIGWTMFEFEVALLGFGLCFEGWQLATYGDAKIYESNDD